MSGMQKWVVLFLLCIAVFSSVRPVICEGWHFTHMWRAHTWPHHLTKRGCLGPLNQFYSATFYWSFCTKPWKWASMCLCGKISILQLSTILIFAFGIVPTVWYFLLVILFYPHNLILFMIFVSLPVFAMNTRH